MTRVKICGITDVSAATAAIDAGAGLIGVVFFARSHRRVTPDTAREIAAAASERGVPVVGVFVNTPPDEINALAASCGLDMVQLSGDETWECFQQIERPVIKAVRIPRGMKEGELLAYLEEDQRRGARPAAYLLDTLVDRRYGGTGQSFDWEIARKAAAEYPLIIAGGLNAAKVGRVVSGLRPWGVDVSSGVETDGVKDAAKIRAFVAAVRAAQ